MHAVAIDGDGIHEEGHYPADMRRLKEIELIVDFTSIPGRAEHPPEHSGACF